ncbi:MAG: cadherin-like domain-containing protein, partial [Ilumatobacter sp.]|nr:cadherin-like domain-containing protein [Ilumatobacter sp.]
PGVLFNDGAASGDEAELVSGAAHGLVVLNANGSFTYTPNPGYVGPDQFVYRVLSGDVELGTATVSITVNGAAGGGQIPATGTGSLSLTLTATGLLGVGMALSAASRRRRPA